MDMRRADATTQAVTATELMVTVTELVVTATEQMATDTEQDTRSWETCAVGRITEKGRSRGELCGAPDSGPFYFSAGLLFSASYDIPVFSAVSFRTYFPESTFRRQALTGYQLQLPQISSISSGVIRLSISRMRSI